jgi:hypothetical protein
MPSLEEFDRGFVVVVAVEVGPDAGEDRHGQPLAERRQVAVEAGFDQLDRRGCARDLAHEAGQVEGQLAVSALQSRRDVAVDDAAHVALLVEIDDLLGGALRSHVVCLVRVGTQMRQHEVRDIGHALGTGFVFGVDVVQIAQPLLGLDRAQRLLVDDAEAGAVDNGGALLHEADQLGADQAARALAARDVERDIIALAEDLLQRRGLDAEVAQAVAVDQRVVTQHAALEALEGVWRPGGRCCQGRRCPRSCR